MAKMRYGSALCTAFVGIAVAMWHLLACSVYAATHTADVATPSVSVRLAGPGAMVSFGLLCMVEFQPLADQGIAFSFQLWRDPDQLRALTIGQAVDIVAMPSNVAANLYNRGVPLRLVNISEWGMLKLVSSQASVYSVADMQGDEIAVPFRGDMPDIVLQHVMRAQGFDPHQDFRFRYVASPMDAAQLLMSSKVKHALLAEPAASHVLLKSQRFPVNLFAPTLQVAVDVQQEWGRIWERPPLIPQAGLTVLGDVVKQPQLLDHIQRAYSEAVYWCERHATECGQLVAKHINFLQPEAVTLAVEQRSARVVSAVEAKAELEFFYQQLAALQPQLIGGHLPDDGFYQPSMLGTHQE